MLLARESIIYRMCGLSRLSLYIKNRVSVVKMVHCDFQASELFIEWVESHEFYRIFKKEVIVVNMVSCDWQGNQSYID